MTRRCVSGRSLPLHNLHSPGCKGSVAIRPRRGKYASLCKAAADPAAGEAVQDWHDVTSPRLWMGSEDDCLTPGAPTRGLPPAWKLMLMSDGSVTRHLQQLTGQSVTVECLQMQQLPAASPHAPEYCSVISGPLVQRQVLLHAGPQELRAPLVYAASWWCGATVDEYLRDKSKPIWVSLSQGRMELYRQIQEVAYGGSPELEELLGCEGPFWGRKYFFWNSGRPLTLIHEVFSNKLQDVLGPLPTSIQMRADG